MEYSETELKYLRQWIADGDLIIESDGAGKWKTNGSYLMSDVAKQVKYLGQPIDLEATAKKRDAQVTKELAEYRRRWKAPSGEALAEMRAEFGAGTEMVDVLSGRRFTL